MKQTDLLRTDRAGEEYFIEEPRDFAQDACGAKKKTAFQKIRTPISKKLEGMIYKMLCRRVRRRIHGRTSCEKGVGSAYAKRQDDITL